MRGLTLQFWQSVVLCANIVALACGVLTGAALFVSAWVSSNIADVVQQDADKRITDARTRGDEARADAAKANQRASEAAERAAGLEKDAAQLRLDLERERAKTSARPWTKEQFDAIQEIKGTVTDVGILWPEHCIECQVLGEYIASALHSAGARVFGAHGVSDYTGTGIFVRLPVGSDLYKHPLIVALGKAGLNPMSAHHNPEYSKIRTDIPVIFVGERFLAILAMPYQPPGQASWAILPIEKQ